MRTYEILNSSYFSPFSSMHARYLREGEEGRKYSSKIAGGREEERSGFSPLQSLICSHGDDLVGGGKERNRWWWWLDLSLLFSPFSLSSSFLCKFVHTLTRGGGRGNRRMNRKKSNRSLPDIETKKNCAHEIKEAEEEGEIEMCVEIWHEIAWESSLLFREFPGCRYKVEIHSCVEEDGPVRAMCVCV